MTTGLQPPEQPKQRPMHRTITGSRMNLDELESLINAAAVRDDGDSSSVSSSHTGTRSNIIQITGKKKGKSAMRAALKEAQGYGDPDDPSLEDLTLGSDDDSSEYSNPDTPKSGTYELKHNTASLRPTEPLEGSGTSRRLYQESSAPPEGAGGYQTGDFIPPMVEENKPPSLPRFEPVGNGMQRTVTGSSLKLSELNDLVEKAAGEKDSEYPGTPNSRGARTPRSQSNMSLSSSRASSIIQIVPGVKDIRTTLAQAIADANDPEKQSRLSFDSTADKEGGPMQDRQGLSSTPSGTAPGGSASFTTTASAPPGGQLYRPRSIRRLMSEKSLAMDTVYSGSLLADDTPTDPLEGTGLVTGRKYVEPRHGPQRDSQDTPRDFPRVVNGVPTVPSGEYEEGEKRASVPPSPMRKSGVVRTISGSQMDLAQLNDILEKAAIPKHERTSHDARSVSTGTLSQTTHRSIYGAGQAINRNSQVFGEGLQDEPTTTFGVKAKSIDRREIEDLIRRASVSRSQPDSPRSVASSGAA